MIEGLLGYDSDVIVTKKMCIRDRCRLIPTTWEWSDEIDLERAKRAKARAEEKMNKSGLSEVDVYKRQVW